MYKRIFLFITLFLSLSVIAKAQEYEQGAYYATINTNIRLQPYATARRIGHLQKGEKITVIKNLSDWCEIKYKNYQKSYVYCPLLAKTTEVNKTIHFNTFYSTRQGFYIDLPEPFVFYDDLNPMIGKKTTDTVFDFAFSLFQNYDQEYETEGQQKEFITAQNFKITLSYYRKESNPSQKLIIAAYDENFPITGNYLAFWYDSNKYLDGEKILEKILNSVKPEHHRQLIFKNNDKLFTFEYPQKWLVNNDYNLSPPSQFSVLKPLSLLPSLRIIPQKIPRNSWKKIDSQIFRTSKNFPYTLDFFEVDETQSIKLLYELAQIRVVISGIPDFDPQTNMEYFYLKTDTQAIGALKKILESFHEVQ